MTGSPGPLRAVLAARAGGAITLSEISRLTGLAPDVARLAVERLQSMGRLKVTELHSGCPSGGCAGCGRMSHCDRGTLAAGP